MTTTHTDPLVHSVTAHGVATITLDSPHNRNALSAQLRSQLHTQLDGALEDDAARIVVLTHTGPTFCAGADLKETRGADPSAAADELAGVLLTMMTASKPIVASISGPARAGGIGLLASCDFVVADPAATFAFSEVRIGVIPSIISVPLKQVVSRADLRRLFLTGAVFDAHHALRIGLVSHLTDDAPVDTATSKLVDALLHGAPQALAGAKAITRSSEIELAEQLDQMKRLTTQFFSSADAQEGMRAFAEKRAPSWATK
ncbi:enoyl-CoA hydratase-related protein [Rhodococcus erythropolis]|uniref:enoyl-CoA hydratase-related protein n=1 Tax=Rhodococcus erythropolis TaxID=1833 RepID=UPI00382122DF